MIDSQLFLQLLVSGIVKGSQYALIATSFGIIFSTTQIFHLAHAAVYAAAAYGVVTIADSLGWSIWLALPFGVVTALVIGAMIELGVYRPMRRGSATKLVAFLASLGISIVSPNLIQIIFGPENRRVARFSFRTFEVRKITFTSLDVVEVIVGWALIALLLVFMNRTQYGRAINAARTNPLVAMAVGISLDRIYLLVILLGSLLASIASILFVVNNVAFPTMGLEPILIGFIAVFFGGADSLPGAALGGFTLGLLTSLSGIWLSGVYSPVVVFGMLFLVLVFRPQGLLGKASV